MNTLKYNNMMQAYTGFKGQATVADITSRIPASLLDALTGAQLGEMMNAIHRAYQDGKASVGAEVIDSCVSDGAVWVNCLNRAIEWQGETATIRPKNE